jgi:fructose-1,6-bisphosphatase/inositol monophosphatase family enzyme
MIGVAMKEMVRRAMLGIEEQRFIFEAQVKRGYGGKLDDLKTTADTAAQGVYIELLRDCFPEYGIVAEEDKLSVPCTMRGRELFFTVDPLDGTKAFVRRQSHGIGTMISLVRDRTVIAAYVGDVMTREIYGYRPESQKTYRINNFDRAFQLQINPKLRLRNQFALLRTSPHKHSLPIRRLVGSPRKPGLFRDIEITGGSIGVSMARLWKGEVGAAILQKGHQTPWDLAPIVGISQHLGFVFLEPTRGGQLRRYDPLVCRELQYRDRDAIVVHESRVRELEAFLR